MADTVTTDYTMTIDGAAVRPAATFGVVNPATAEVFAEAPDCTPEQLDAAFASAARAFGTWRGSYAERRQHLAAAATAVDAAAEQLAAVLTSEQGKPITNARAEVGVVATWLRYFADLELPREVIQDDEEAFAELIRRPLGPVAAITPWNYPLTLAAWKLGPALLAGNTVVLKPSPFTPLATLKLGEVLREVLPPGVVNVISGGDRLGGAMTRHPAVRKISFTGSIETGKRVYAAAAPDLKHVTLELGGNDPAILLDDVDIEAVAERIFWGSFANAGQVCSAIKRIYVPQALHGQLADALVARAEAVRVGDGASEATEMGPINNRPQFERVSELVADALRQGATALTGGAPLDRPGYFFAPTVLTGIEDGVRIVDEEQFGPALPLVPYRDLDDALARANATHFGLSGSVWSADPERAADVATRMECGQAWVNCHMAFAPDMPSGGNKWSGIGVENGPWGVHQFTEMQLVLRPRRDRPIYR